jgi:biopolymer transport protein TolQ
MHISLGSLQIFASAYSQSDLFGKLIFLSLFLLSAICWVVLIYKTWMHRQVRHLSSSFQSTFEKKRDHWLSMEREDFSTSEHREIPHPFAEIFFALKQKTLEILSKNRFFAEREGREGEIYLSSTDLESIESHVLTTLSGQMKRLEKNLFVLSTIVTLAPFLGLLGTVWGILITFGQLQTGGSVSSNTLVLGGLSTALATTVLGLVIAIPALISYNHLRNSTRKISSDTEDFIYNLLSTVELHYRKSDL